ncbi:MAG: hypothetical protein RJB13_966 [Pseudomonadota bacterium]
MSTNIEGEYRTQQHHSARWFERALILYLGFPVLIFLYYWLNAGAAFFNIALLLLAVHSSWKAKLTNETSELPQKIKNNFRNNAAVYLIILAWCCLSGIGGAGFQNTDYAASNALLKDLIENPWPLTLSENKPLVYYVAYYLPAALVGKLLNWQAAQVVIFAWSYLGLILMWNILSAALELNKISRLQSLLAVSIFIFFGGWDVLGALFNHNYGETPLGTHIEWWAQIAQFSSHTTLLFWVPQHVIAPWLVTAYILFLLNRKGFQHSLLLFASLSFLWSPIASLGLLPFIGIVIASQYRENKLNFFQIPNNFFIGPVFAALGVLFYSSNTIHFANHWQFTDRGFARNYFLLILLEVLPLSLPFFLQHLRQQVFLSQIGLPPPIKLSINEKILGWSAIAVLLALPLYKFGIMNDLAMRASIPALLVLCGFYLKVLRAEFSFQFKQILPTLICIIVGSGAAFNEMYRSVLYFSFGAPNVSNIGTLRNQPDNETIEQRAGNPETLFWKWLGPVSKKRDSTPSK